MSGVFRHVQVIPEVTPSGVIFRFPIAVSLLVLAVSTADDMVWSFEAQEFEPLPESATVSNAQLWPVDEAPPEIVKALRQMEKRAEQELAEFGPTKPLISSVAYGEIPTGYKSDSSAPRLPPGDYSVMVFAEQGQGAAAFTVPAG